MMTVVIHQPDFLPHLGFFHRFLYADLYIALDHAQFVSGTSRSWTHRDRIKTPRGAQWLTVSVRKPSLGTPIREVLLSNSDDWRIQNLRLLRENYRHAPHFEEVFPELEALYADRSERLYEFSLASIDMLSRLFDVTRPRLLSSSLSPQGKSVEMLVGLLGKVGARVYLSGQGARTYHRQAPFDAAGIQVAWQEFRHPVYPQLHGDFIPYLSSIDLLFNCGVERSRQILESC